MIEMVEKINGAINGFVWGIPMLVLLVGTGILMTILTKVSFWVLDEAHAGQHLYRQAHYETHRV